MDLKYDPITVLTRGQVATLKKQVLSDEKKSARTKNNVNTNRRSSRACAVVDVHDEKPSFFNDFASKE